MSYPLPEQQPYRPVVGQRPAAPLEGWPVEHTAVVPAMERHMQPTPERRIVGYERYAGGLVPVYETAAPVLPSPPRDLSPQPVIDPRAQLVLAGGVGAGAAGAGLGWGVGQAAAGIAALGGSSALLVIAALLLLAKLGRRGHGGDTYNYEITNNNRLWGHSSTRTK